jgi:dTDP-4-amino-4,6-dideoxygalactose transaminase
MKSRVPFLDLAAPHAALEEELVEVFRSALKTACFIGGSMVEGLEQDFAEFCATKYCVGVSSGTDALRFALMAAGVVAGDCVVTVPNTFIATTEAITQAQALPEFVDIDERTYNMDPARLREYLENECDSDPRTRQPISRRSGRPVTAVVPVHLYGQTAEMDPILELAETYNLIVVEDSCQAHGAEYYSDKEQSWKKAGSMGRAAAFSFYPGKNLGACGEAGAVTTNNEKIARKVRLLRDHGQAEKYYHDIEGYNGRLDAIQAGILWLKLRHLSDWNCRRRKQAEAYQAMLSSADGLDLPFEPRWARAVYHLYVIRARDREQLRNYLGAASVGTGIHYPIPLHLQKAYCTLGYQKGDFPVTERVAAEILSLPIYPELGRPEQEYVVENVLSHLHFRRCVHANHAQEESVA